MVIISDPVAVLAFGGSSDVPFKVAATVQLAHGAWNAGRSGGLGSRWEREHQLEENKKRDRSNETTLFTHCDLHPSES